jgi:V8-like Glu-specific endopeptidase
MKMKNMKMNTKSKIVFCLILFSSVFLNVKAAEKNGVIKIVPKVIYGTDDRLDLFESSDSLMKDLARSTAAQILKRNIVQSVDENNKGLYTVKSKTLQQDGICQSERFSGQNTAASCSGFLIASDILVTAGHCVTRVGDCEEHSWVFDYANTTEENKTFTFKEDQVYHCTAIISREKDLITLNDYSVLKLDRPVVGRTPLQFRTAGKAADDAVFTIIGHPSGLPTKITSGADMRDNTNPLFFRTNSDTYGGNSGSAVIDSRTGIVEGILVRGDTDYKSSDKGCLVSVEREQNGGRGEDATRITNIKTN